jgi:hypothetical protein
MSPQHQILYNALILHGKKWYIHDIMIITHTVRNGNILAANSLTINVVKHRVATSKVPLTSYVRVPKLFLWLRGCSTMTRSDITVTWPHLAKSEGGWVSCVLNSTNQLFKSTTIFNIKHVSTLSPTPRYKRCAHLCDLHISAPMNKFQRELAHRFQTMRHWRMDGVVQV